LPGLMELHVKLRVPMKAEAGNDGDNLIEE
jgi:hypothetical protein